MDNQPYIIIIDDDHDDVDLLKDCFKEINSFSIRTFFSGSSFLDFITRKDFVYPCLIILDLNLPVVSGIEILQRIKSNFLFEQIPIVVFSTGGTLSEMAVCNMVNVEIFKKPSSIKQWQSVVSMMAAHCAPSPVNEQNGILKPQSA